MTNAIDAAMAQADTIFEGEASGPNVHIALAGALLQKSCHGASRAAGWWVDKKTGIDMIEAITNPHTPVMELIGQLAVTQKLCLSHSELSEGMEGFRKGLMDDKLPHRPMIEVELGDAVIRIFDLAGAMGLDLGGAIAEKMAYNAVRPDHKPEARAGEGGKAF